MKVRAGLFLAHDSIYRLVSPASMSDAKVRQQFQELVQSGKASRPLLTWGGGGGCPEADHVEIVVSFLLGKSPASVYYCMPTFRNSLSVPSSKATVEH